MVDAGGPGCITLALSDLGDTEGFDARGEENKIYAFQLAGGVYRRVAVSESETPVQFEDLSDVDTTGVQPNKYYSLLYQNSKWIPYIDVIREIGGWDLDFVLKTTTLSIGKGHVLRKIRNSGNLLASLVPNKGTQAIINRFEENGKYCVTTADGSRGILELRCEFGDDIPPPASTVNLKIMLGAPTEDFVPVIQGLSIKWRDVHANKELSIYIRREGDGGRVQFSMEGIETNVSITFPLDKVYIGNISLIRFAYCHITLPFEYLSMTD